MICDSGNGFQQHVGENTMKLGIKISSSFYPATVLCDT